MKLATLGRHSVLLLRGLSYSNEEALANIGEAIDLYVQDLVEASEPIPLDQGHDRATGTGCNRYCWLYDPRPAWHFGAQIYSRLEADGFGLQRLSLLK
jgi:hypothetical protein